MSRANPRFRRFNPLAAVPMNNVIRVQVVGSLENQLTINTFYYIDNSSVGVALTANVAFLNTGLQAAGNLFSKYSSCPSSDMVLNYAKYDSPNNPTFAPVYGPITYLCTGAAGHEPTEVAALIIKGSALRGQCGRGRVSIPAIPTNAVSASRINTGSSFWTAFQALAAQMQVSVSSGGVTFVPVVFSKGTRVTRQLGVTQLTSANPLTLLGTIRRRKIGRGK